MVIDGEARSAACSSRGEISELADCSCAIAGSHAAGQSTPPTPLPAR